MQNPAQNSHQLMDKNTEVASNGHRRCRRVGERMHFADGFIVMITHGEPGASAPPCMLVKFA